jgi:hypothetical protein
VLEFAARVNYYAALDRSATREQSMANAYQCFTLKSTRAVWCSSKKINGHDKQAEWQADCIAAHKFQASDITNSRNVDKQPAGANLWP